MLAGLCFTPELYCCGVDVVGPSHVLTLFQSIPAYWAPIKKQLIDRVGDVEADDEVNRKISPLYHVDKITCALIPISFNTRFYVHHLHHSMKLWGSSVY